MLLVIIIIFIIIIMFHLYGILQISFKILRFIVNTE